MHMDDSAAARAFVAWFSFNNLVRPTRHFARVCVCVFFSIRQLSSISFTLIDERSFFSVFDGKQRDVSARRTFRNAGKVVARGFRQKRSVSVLKSFIAKLGAICNDTLQQCETRESTCNLWFILLIDGTSVSLIHHYANDVNYYDATVNNSGNTNPWKKFYFTTERKWHKDTVVPISLLPFTKGMPARSHNRWWSFHDSEHTINTFSDTLFPVIVQAVLPTGNALWDIKVRVFISKYL